MKKSKELFNLANVTFEDELINGIKANGNKWYKLDYGIIGNPPDFMEIRYSVAGTGTVEDGTSIDDLRPNTVVIVYDK